MKARVISFYLPQFHPIPENDQWWEKGFTEWSNVARAQPLFPGHYQPHLPADLGFYDLRLPDARQAQADLASHYGIHGFCYYHYWFNGRLLLERPFHEVLTSGKPDFPFCLCWANENWTRIWDGQDQHVLMKQEYSEADDRNHIRWLLDAFQDRRYIRVEGKPLFLVYRANALPDPLRTTSLWRDEVRRAGLGDLYLCRVESVASEGSDPAEYGFDAAVEFQPMGTDFGPLFRRGKIWDWLRRLRLVNRASGVNLIFDYATVIENALARASAPYKCYPCVMPSWDNTPRRPSGAVMFKGATPTLYGQWLEAVLERFSPYGPDENFVFINAWNEWGEGNHLEPCQRWGRAYLEATKKAVTGRG
jgi:lipopolysaccharide biosynthesis protein